MSSLTELNQIITHNTKDITLALGGGGAKGNAHIGVLRKLEHEGFTVRAVAGTSFGGIVAIFYALGYSPDEIEDLFSTIDQKQLYGFDAEAEPSLLGLSGATKWLHDTIGIRTFDDLKIPCILTAVDLQSGQETHLSTGSLIDAILATIAIPGIFPARRTGKYELVDGGTLNPVPVELARSLMPKLPVIAVVLSRPLGEPAASWNIPMPEYVPRTLIDRLSRTRYSQALDVFLRSLDIVTRAVTEYRLMVDKPEIILRPAVSEIEFLDRVDVRVVAKLGEDAVEDVLAEINRLFGWQNRLRRSIRI